MWEDCKTLKLFFELQFDKSKIYVYKKVHIGLYI